MTGTTSDDQALMRYDHSDGITATLESLTGTLRAYHGGLATSAADAFFTYDIATDGPRTYVGSGALDGDGIPTDFFSDIHVRKGFNYAFDWDQYIQDTLQGEGIQRRGPIINGVMGYSDSQSSYFYSPTLALEELNQAWGGQVSTVGFSLTLAYIEGNTTRRAVADIVKDGIEGLDSKFRVSVIALESAEFWGEQGGRRLPIFVSGWGQDYPHPHNWVVPYLIGTYAGSQNMPDDLRAKYQTKANNCVRLTGYAARACYEDIQEATFLDATDIFLAQAKTRTYAGTEVRGYYTNPGMATYFYALSKGPAPTVETVTPGADQTVEFTGTHGTKATILLPAHTVTRTVDVVATSDVRVGGAPGGYRLGAFTFEIQAFDGTGTLIPSLTLGNAMTITLEYNAPAVGTLREDTLRLFWWDGSSWLDAACGEYVRDLANDMLQLPICHLSTFALGGTSVGVFLPLVIRSS